MLKFDKHCLRIWLLSLSACWLLGCGVPPAENPTEQSSTPNVESPGQPAEQPDKTVAASEESDIEAPSPEPAETSESGEAAPPAESKATEPKTDIDKLSQEETRDFPIDPLEEEYVEPPPLPAPPGATAMPAPNRVWIDAEKKSVIVDGYISLQEGMLEMFACPVGTKEHESIVAVYSSAQIVHAALLAVGAEVGTPVQFNPEFKPPTGTEIAIEVRWQDKQGKWQSIEAQQLITDIKTEKPMAHPWVFAGSDFYKDEETGEEFYMAESGDFICVSNFSTATLDIPVESSQVNDGLLFEANVAKVPPLWTPVRLVLTPKLGEDAK